MNWSRFTQHALLCAFMFTLLAGCGQSKNQGNTGGSRTGPTATTHPPTDQECEKFGADFVKAAYSGDKNKINRLVDYDGIFKESVSGIIAPKNFKSSFLKNVKKTVRGKMSICGLLTDAAKNGGSVKLLRIHEVDKQKRALVRLVYSEDGGFNYFDFILVRKGKNNIIAEDVYMYINAETLSAGIRRMYRLALSSINDRSIWEKLTKKQSAEMKAIGKLSIAVKRMQAKDFKGAARLIEEMPESLRQQKSVMLLKLRIASHADEKDYAKVIDEFRRLYPKDPALDFISLDGYAIAGKYDHALKCIDRLDKSLGGDPYLDVMRAGIHLQLEDYEKANACYFKGATEEPSSEFFYTNGLNLSALTGDKKETLKWLKLYHKNLPEKLAEVIPIVESAPGFDGVSALPEYKAWKKTL